MPTKVLAWVPDGDDEIFVLDPQRLVDLFDLPRGTHPFIVQATVSGPDTGILAMRNDNNAFYTRRKPTDASRTFAQLSAMNSNIDNADNWHAGSGDASFFESTTGGVGFSETISKPLGWDITHALVLARNAVGDTWTMEFFYQLAEGELNWLDQWAQLEFNQVVRQVSPGAPYYQMHDRFGIKRKVGIQ